MALPLAPSPLASPPAPMLPCRRRGGQPGNRNAFCRGMVSARHPSSLAAISATLASIASERRRSPQAAARHIPALRSMLSEGFQLAQDPRLLLAQAPLVTKMVRLSVALRIKNYVLFERENIRLENAAALSMLLIKCSYHEHGIPRDAGSFRGKINKSDLKSSHPSGFFYPSWRNPLARTPRIASGRSSNPSSPCARRSFAGGHSHAPPPGLPARGAEFHLALQPYLFLLCSSGTNTSHLNKVIQFQKWIQMCL